MTGQIAGVQVYWVPKNRGVQNFRGSRRRMLMICGIRNFITCTIHQILLEWLNRRCDATCTGNINAYKILFGKPEGKITLET
jgi:hypothetical protein